MHEWALQDAKARLSEVVQLAMEHEPQEITLRGEPAVVVISRKDYDRLTKRDESLVEFMRRSPLYGVDEVRFSPDQSLTPEIQNLERLYYEPCALCGRASSDPLCRCSSLL